MSEIPSESRPADEPEWAAELGAVASELAAHRGFRRAHSDLAAIYGRQEDRVRRRRDAAAPVRYVTPSGTERVAARPTYQPSVLSLIRENRRAVGYVAIVAFGSMFCLLGAIGAVNRADFSAAEKVVLHNPQDLAALGLCRVILQEAANADNENGLSRKADQLNAAASIVDPNAPCSLPPGSDGTIMIRVDARQAYVESVSGQDLVGQWAPTTPAQTSASPTAPAN